MSPAKTAESINMLFSLLTQVGRRNHVLDGGADPPEEWAIFWEKWQPIVSRDRYYNTSACCIRLHQPIAGLQCIPKNSTRISASCESSDVKTF